MTTFNDISLGPDTHHIPKHCYRPKMTISRTMLPDTLFRNMTKISRCPQAPPHILHDLKNPGLNDIQMFAYGYHVLFAL